MYVKEEVEEYLQRLEAAIASELNGKDEAQSTLKEKIAGIRALMEKEEVIGTDSMGMAEAIAIMAGLNFITLKKHREPLI